MKVKVNIIHPWCITMSEALSMPSLMMTTSIVSEESLARDTPAPPPPPPKGLMALKELFVTGGLRSVTSRAQGASASGGKARASLKNTLRS